MNDRPDDTQRTVDAAIDAPALPDSPLRLGDVLLDDFEVTGIRPGGFGFVYVARHRPSGRRWAVKTPRRTRQEAFAEEVAFWLKLPPHPNIVTAHLLGEVDGRFYLFMDYVDGDLRAKLQHAGRHGLSQVEALRIVYGIALGMLHANAKGQVAHLDLKPGNILVDDDAQPKITDFGLARRVAIQRGRFRTVSAGTWAYAAPEVFTGRPVDSRSDLFSLGIIAYELLTGTPRPLPFTVPDDAGEAFRLMRSYYESDEPKRFADSLYYGSGQIDETIRDRATLALVRGCLAAQRYDRFKSFTELADFMQWNFGFEGPSGSMNDDAAIGQHIRMYARADALQQMGQVAAALDIYNRLLTQVTDDPDLRVAILGSVVEALNERRELGDASLFEEERRRLLGESRDA